MVRGGRFVSGFVGEQYALPEAVESLRAVRRIGLDCSASMKPRVAGARTISIKNNRSICVKLRNFPKPHFFGAAFYENWNPDRRR